MLCWVQVFESALRIHYGSTKQPGGMGSWGEQGPPDLAALIGRARAGNLEAWGEIYRLFAAPIFRFCRRALPTREDAEMPRWKSS